MVEESNAAGATAGILGGLAVGTAYLIHVAPAFGNNPPIIPGVDHLRFGIPGAVASLILMVVVSLATKEPDAATQRMVDEVRVPSGKAILTFT